MTTNRKNNNSEIICIWRLPTESKASSTKLWSPPKSQSAPPPSPITSNPATLINNFMINTKEPEIEEDIVKDTSSDEKKDSHKLPNKTLSASNSVTLSPNGKDNKELVVEEIAEEITVEAIGPTQSY